MKWAVMLLIIPDNNR